MSFLWSTILFAACLAGALVCGSIAIIGLWRGKVGYESSSAPFDFASRPVRFVLGITLYIVLAALLGIGLVKSGLSLWRML